jgi:hypothetical protein
MRLFLGGVVHDDPAMVGPLRAWLRDLRISHEKPPAFVAVEWYPDVLNQYPQAWDDFMVLARRDWACAEEHDVHSVADSIAFEAVCADEIFGAKRILWLDSDRHYDHPGREVFSWHQWRLLLRGEGKRCPTLVKLSLLSRGAAQAAARKPARDKLLADRLLAAVPPQDDSWGVAVLGALHVSNCWPDTTRRILETAGQDCTDPYFFGWEPCLQ